MLRQSRPFVLMTRPQAQSERFVAELAGSNAKFLIAPLMKIERVNAGFPPHDGDFVLTSENALRTLPEIYRQPGQRAFCVGKRTAKAARELGFDAVSADGNADDLRNMLLNSDISTKILHLSGAHQASDILSDVPGMQRIITYQQTALKADPQATALLHGETQVIIPLFSPRSARLFCNLYSDIAAPVHIMAISKATADAVTTEVATKIDIAAQPDGDNMKKMVADLIKVIGKT